MVGLPQNLSVVATPDARGQSLIEKERERRQTLSPRSSTLRERSPAIRTALRAMAGDEAIKSPAARLADRLAGIETPNPEVSAAPKVEPAAQPTFAKPRPQPEPTMPRDVIPAPRTGFSLLELAQKPGAPLISRGEGLDDADRPAVNVNTTLNLLKGQK